MAKEAMDALCDIRLLAGRDLWLRHATFGRLRRMMEMLDVVYSGPMRADWTLDQITEALRSHHKSFVNGVDGRSGGFTIKELIRDIRQLAGEGIDLFQTETLADPLSDDELKRAIGAYFTDGQLIYKEIVEENFSNMKHEFGFYSSMPVRWNITIVRDERSGDSQHVSWRAVAAWSDAGADVVCTDTLSVDTPFDRGFDALFRTLKDVGRMHPRASYWESIESVPDFDGSEYNGAFTGDTNAMRTAYELLRGDLADFFSEMPVRD
jgi:hypothetical protein